MASTISAGTSTGSALNMTGDTSGALALQTNNGTTAVTINTSQQVGVGTASPDTTLTVQATGANGLNLKESLSNSTLSSRLLLSNATSGQSVSLYNNAGNLLFTTGATVGSGSGTERMRIDTSGNVGIGINAPVSRLDVNASTPAFLYSYGQLNVRTTEAQGAGKGAMISLGGFSTTAQANSYNFGVIGAYKTNSTSEDYSSYMILGTSDVYSNVLEAVRIDATQRVKFASGISVGNATPATDGKGITFPATQSASTDANTLDDYEEGTFTPTATAGTPGAVPPTFAYDFRYTKIGRVVSITGYFYINTAGTASGNLNFTGFPFTTGNFGYAPVGTATEQALTNQLCQMRVENNSTSGRVTAVTGGGVVWTNGGQYVVSITYIAA